MPEDPTAKSAVPGGRLPILAGFFPRVNGAEWGCADFKKN
jgi:hypothetical protein